jgi:HEAT repeat protein
LQSSEEERAVRRIYAHVRIGDPASGAREAREALDRFPASREVYDAAIHALCSAGEDREALALWEAMTARFPEAREDRALLETLAWGVLRKAEGSPQLTIQVNALLGASFTRDAQALPVLLTRLRDSNALLRSLAVRLAAQYGDAPLREELMRLLQQERVWWVRLEVMRALGLLRMTEAREALAEIAAQPKGTAEERGTALVALMRMYDAIERKELRSLVCSARAGLRALACEVALHLELETDAPELFPLLHDPSPEVRVLALNAICLLRAEGAASRVLPLLDDSAPEVAITAAWAAALLGESEGISRLCGWMCCAEPEQRRMASAAAAALGPLAVDVCAAVLQTSEDSYVKANLALGLIGQRRDVEGACAALLSLLSAEGPSLWMWESRLNPLFRSLAPSRVRHIEEVPNYPALVDQRARLELLSVLSMMRYPGAEEAVRSFLTHQAWGVAGAAAAVLVEEGDADSAECVRGLLQDPDEKIRVQAALILALVGSDMRAVEVLQDAYALVDRERKIEILEALARLGDPQSIPFLASVLSEPFQVLRVVAASALIQCLRH